MTNEFRPHEIQWTNEKSKRLWDFASSQPGYENSYFSNAVGNLLLKHVCRTVRLEGRILDFGCGPGYLMQKLIARGIPVQGIDFSEDSIAIVNKKLSGHPLFKGARIIDRLPLDIPDGQYNIVFLIEAIEHLLPDVFDITMAEVSRLLQRGGKIIITTPNREHLATNIVMCPECGCKFHRIQHVRSWSAEILSLTMERFGFRKIRTDETTFRRGDALNHLFKIGFILTRRRQPNLVYIGEKA